MRKSISALLALTAIGTPTLAAPAGEQVRQTFRHDLPGLPGKALVAVEVAYPPGGTSPPHRHAASAFIYARVLSGSVVSQVDGAPARTYRAGDSFYELPGAHHSISRNASLARPARLLAVFVVDAVATALTTPDRAR